jgi:hypothetical protein
MRFRIEPRGDHLAATLQGRETPGQMREFLVAVHAACRSHGCPRILMSIRQSRPVFKPEDYGLSMDVERSYVRDLVTDKCQVALVGDTLELHAAHEYIEVCARQQKMNVRAFRDEPAALRWLRGAPEPGQRYKFTRTVLQGAPDERGVYALWDGDELVYYGRASARPGSGATIRACLLGHLERTRATHYSWEVCADPAAREAQLLRDFERLYGRPPRDNKESA